METCGDARRVVGKLVVGLGNPGPRYRMTRHNVGFLVVDLVAEAAGCGFRRTLRWSEVAEGRRHGARVSLLKPLCFMNRSGAAVLEAMRGRGDDAPDILVVYDDFALPLGGIRFRATGSAGGHRGMGSVLEALGTEDVARLRVGIGGPPPGEDPAEYVLSSVPRSEWAGLRRGVQRAADGVDHWIRCGSIEDCMNRYNQDIDGRTGTDAGDAARTGREE